MQQGTRQEPRDPDGGAPARPLLDGAERAGLHALVREEIARRRPHAVALRSLELIAAAAVEPAEGRPGYRIVDRDGAPLDLTLAEHVDAIVRRHPELFQPPEPEPEAAEPARETGLSAGASEMRAATARFVETQSERARALAERSSVQGRAFARSAGAAVAGLRARLTSPRAGPQIGPQIEANEARSAPVPDAGRAAPAAREALHRVGTVLRDWRDGGLSDQHHRRWVAGGAGALLAMILAAGIIAGYRRSGEDPDAPAREASQPARTAEAPAAPPEASPETPPPETEGPPEPPEAAPRPVPGATTGTAQVIDTATLRINGKLIRLFGVEWVRGGQADELARYINNRPVTCQPVAGSDNQNCQIEGRDLSEVVLFNGGGRASPEATPELVAAEDHARSERLGVWKR